MPPRCLPPLGPAPTTLALLAFPWTSSFVSVGPTWCQTGPLRPHSHPENLHRSSLSRESRNSPSLPFDFSLTPECSLSSAWGGVDSLAQRSRTTGQDNGLWSVGPALRPQHCLGHLCGERGGRNVSAGQRVWPWPARSPDSGVPAPGFVPREYLPGLKETRFQVRLLFLTKSDNELARDSAFYPSLRTKRN